MHGVSQNSKNSKRVTRKTNFNMKLETLTVQVYISQPLDTYLHGEQPLWTDTHDWKYYLPATSLMMV